MTVHRIGEPHHTRHRDPDDEDPVPVDRFTWERYIRRAPLPSMTKLVGLTMATYADHKGRKIHPGDESLALDCGVTKRSIVTHRLELERLGLLIRVAEPKHGPGGRAAEFITSWPPSFNRLGGVRGINGEAPLVL